MSKKVKPPALKLGETIAIAASSSPVDKKEFLVGVSWLRECGFKVVFQEDIFSKTGYLAGEDQRRADELNRYIEDPSVSAILFGRGGYGMQRTLPLVDISPLHEKPKIIMGYSDITPLLSYLINHNISGTIYGPTVAHHFKRAMPSQTMESFKNIAMNPEPFGVLPTESLHIIKEGNATGKILGGCLTLLSTSIGTHFEITSDDKNILFLEDQNEPSYRIDRMLTHLKNAGKLQNTTGIIFGSLKPPDLEKNPGEIHEIISNIFSDFPGPIVSGFQTGHFPYDAPFISIPLGVQADINTNNKRITIEESLVR